MSLTARETENLHEIETEIAQIEHRLSAAHGLGDSHSSQGVSANFTDLRYWRSALTQLRRRRDQLEAKRDGQPIPPAAGVTVSRYIQTGATPL